MAASRRAVVAHVYVSEGRDSALIARMSAAGSATGAAVANEFMDAPYHRAGITLASICSERLEAGIVAVCREALLNLDLRSHIASHPRVGTVDHVACNPLGEATCEEAADVAIRVAQHLGSGALGSAIPVYLYGAAREDSRSLAELRRSLGYFGGARKGEWVGLPPQVAAAQRELAPDYGPAQADERHGLAVIGAVPFVHNYNLLVIGEDLDQAELMTRCRRIARSVSARGGGLPSVESMALPHERGVEVACNLLDVAQASPPAVRTYVQALCESEGVHLDSDYFTNKTPDELLQIAAGPV